MPKLQFTVSGCTSKLKANPEAASQMSAVPQQCRILQYSLQTSEQSRGVKKSKDHKANMQSLPLFYGAVVMAR